MPIQHLCGNPQIAAAAVNSPPFKRGERGAHVALYQKTLYSLGFDLPRSLIASAQPGPEFDGIFGDETQEKTREFQTEQMLNDDGIVGEKTVFMLFTVAGFIPLVIPHDPDLLDRARPKIHARAAVMASLAENFIKNMDFYLGR